MAERKRTVKARARFVPEQKLASGEIIPPFWEIFPLGQYRPADREVLETWDEELPRALAKFEKNVFDLYGGGVDCIVKSE